MNDQFYGYGFAPAYSPPGFQRQSNARQSGLDWIFVPNIRDAAGVTVPPGGKAWIMAQDEPIFAVRVADNLGMIKTDYYRFAPCDPAAEEAAEKNAQFVTRDEFTAALQELRTALISGKERTANEPSV